MKKFTTLVSLLCLMLLISYLQTSAQLSFTNSNNLLSDPNMHSGCAVSVADVNDDGLDDIVHMDDGHIAYIEFQVLNGQFTQQYMGDIGGSSAWAMCIADVDNNGHIDLIADGSGGIRLLKANASGTNYAISTLPNSGFFLQNASFADVNNDGAVDIFCCDDNAENHIYGNNGTGTFTENGWIDFDVTNTPDGGNYGNVWSDFDDDGDIDLYVAKCRQGTAQSNLERYDVLFVNDGSNNYNEEISAHGLYDNGAMTWTANFGDIDNDGDLDLFRTNYDGTECELFENVGTGMFTDISAGAGFNTSSNFPIESQFEDFDNDGFIDVILSGYFHQFFRNDGDNTFTEITNTLFNGDGMLSFATGDLNHDGFIDVYASYGDVYTTPTNIDDVVWLNDGNDNHFITFNLKGTISNMDAIGAKILLYGAWGIQVREVRAGESYGTTNSFNLHFGLGANTTIDSAVIKWPSGIVTHISNPSADQFLTVIENDCISPNLTISFPGVNAVICPGQTLDLTASALPAGYSYLWSTGETTTTITVSATGLYYVTAVSSNNDCSSISGGINVLQSPDETPTISVTGELVFCSNDGVVLSAPLAGGYTWSNGATTQTITVNQSGSYTVTIDGSCQQWTSAPVIVTANPSATAPTANDVTIPVPGTATLTATGTNDFWYDVVTGGSPIATGNTFNTPFLYTTTNYYVADANSYGGGTGYVGQVDHQGNLYSSSSTTNSTILFNVFEDCKLLSVKVYTDSPGERLIELRDNNGNVIQSLMVDIPDGTNRIDLNFDLPAGNGFELGTNTAQNNILLGTDNPRLQRSDASVNYPYVIQDVLSLNDSPFGSSYYYYFYDWEVEESPVLCESDRTPVTVFVTVGIEGVVNENLFTVYPNPSEGLITVESAVTGQVSVELLDIAGKSILASAEENFNDQLQMDLSALSKGVYFIKMQTATGMGMKKIVIQ